VFAPAQYSYLPHCFWAAKLLPFAGSKVSDTIRKGIIDVDPYVNNTGYLMMGNVAALSGSYDLILVVIAYGRALMHIDAVVDVVNGQQCHLS